MYQILALNAFSDNYIWIIKNTITKHCTAIDPGEAEPVLQWLNQNKSYQLSDILITHHHKDHTGGISQLTEQTTAKVLAPKNSDISDISVFLSDQQTITLLGLTIKVIAVPGHTLDHLAYYFPKQLAIKEPWLFSGDTLFSGGCGRVFEGTTSQMYQSLQKLNQLPAETKIFAAHEYTIGNLMFASLVEPENQIIKHYLAHCQSLQKEHKATLPSTLETERAINPFLRCDQAPVIQAAQQYIKRKLTTPEEVFAVIRDWKNNQS